MDEITIAAVCGAITAVATLANNIVSRRNSRAIKDVHACLDDHIATVNNHISATEAHHLMVPSVPVTWKGNDRRQQDDA